jgi:hypothetical protein
MQTKTFGVEGVERKHYFHEIEYEKGAKMKIQLKF